MLEQSVLEGLHPMEQNHAEGVHGELSPIYGTPHWSSGRV